MPRSILDASSHRQSRWHEIVSGSERQAQSINEPSVGGSHGCSDLLSRAKEKAQAAGSTNVVFLQAGIGDGTLHNNKFDRALPVTVLGEILDEEKGFIEIFRSSC